MKFLILFVSLILPPLCNAAILTGDNGVEILALDGQKIKSSFFTSKAVEVSEGDHQVVVRFANSFGKSEILESKPNIFTLNIQGDTEITVENINNESQAEHAIRKGFTWIVNNSEQTQKIVASDTLLGEGYLPYKNIEKLITAYNQEQGISMRSSTVAAGQGSSEQLICLYNSASKEERKAFRIWLLEKDLKY